MIRMMHQCGHNSVWNKDSFFDEDVGEGLILSPVHETQIRLQRTFSDVLENSLFDPQFYVPGSQKRKLNTYPFFPEQICSGYSRATYRPYSLEAARLCLAFQRDMGFSGLIIPSLYFESFPSDFYEQQEEFSINPFLTAFRELELQGRPTYLTLLISSHTATDPGYRTDLLNWATSFEEVNGIYLIPDIDRESKQVTDGSVLRAYLEVINALRNSGMEVLVGYCNTEALIYTVASDVLTVSCGAYENTRKFSVDKFIQDDEDRYAPTPRIYLANVLNWIDFGQAMEIRDRNEALWQRLYIPSEHANRVISAAAEPTFQTPGLYKHYFEVLEGQLMQLSPLSMGDRRHLLSRWLDTAESLYREIADLGIRLERHGQPTFIQGWRSAIR